MKNILIVLTLIIATISGAIAREVKVAGYIRNGKEGNGYLKTVKDTVEMKGYTKKDGTKVAGYTHRKTK